MDEGIILREKERSLYLGMVPKDTKDLFLRIASEEFSDHYGFCLQWLVEQALEYQRVKEVLLDKDFVEKIINIKNKSIEDNEMEDKVEKVKTIKTLSGKNLKGGKK